MLIRKENVRMQYRRSRIRCIPWSQCQWALGLRARLVSGLEILPWFVPLEASDHKVPKYAAVSRTAGEIDGLMQRKGEIHTVVIQ